MSAALQIAWKDIKQRLRDRSAYVIGVLAPLGLAVIVGSLVGGTSEEVEKMKLAGVDEDGGPVAAAFLEQLDGWEREGAVTIEVTDRARVGTLLEDEGFAAAFVFPEGFSEAIVAGEFAEITVIGDPTQGRSAEVAESLATGFAETLSSIRLSVATSIVASGEPATPATMEALAVEAAAMSPPITLAPVAAVDFTGIDIESYLAAGMTVFFLFFIVQFGILSLIEERDRGTMTRLLAAPIRPASVVMGKALGSLVVGAASVAVLVVATTQIVNAEWGDPLGVALLALAGVLAAVGLVSLIASFVRTEEAARNYSETTAVVLGLMGGAFFPVGLSTGIVSQITWVSPHRWLLEGFRDLNAGDTAVDILPLAGVVLLFAVVAGGIGLLRSTKFVRLS